MEILGQCEVYSNMARMARFSICLESGLREEAIRGSLQTVQQWIVIYLHQAILFYFSVPLLFRGDPSRSACQIKTPIPTVGSLIPSS